MPSRSFNVQSAVLVHPFWTSSCHLSASTSNLPRFLISFGLQHTFPPLQRPIRRACPFLLDFPPLQRPICFATLSLLNFSIPPLRFNVQSAAIARPFWTSAYLPSASTSNLPCLLVPFGLPRAFPPLQRPIRHATSSLLDFLVPSLRFNVQSAVHSRPFWTSAYLPSASTSNLPHLFIHFGLPRAISPLQHPICRACSSLLDFLVPYLRFNVQFTVYPPPPQKGVEFFAPLRSAQSRGPPDLVRPCPKTRLRHVLSINKTPLWSIGKRERRSSRFLTPFFLWTRGESNPCPKTHSLFFYYHS